MKMGQVKQVRPQSLAPSELLDFTTASVEGMNGVYKLNRKKQGHSLL